MTATGRPRLDSSGFSISLAHEPESLRILAEYLERALDSATSIVMMRHTESACTVYLGDPAGLREDLKQICTIPTLLAHDIFESTFSGANQLQIDGNV